MVKWLDKWFLALGLLLLLLGLSIAFYYESATAAGFEYARGYPYQAIYTMLVLAGIGFSALAFFYKPQKETVNIVSLVAPPSNSNKEAEATGGIIEWLKKHLLSIGMTLFVFGGTYQVVNAMWWGWWNAGAIDYMKGLTLQQEIALHLGFLAALLSILSLLSIIIGIMLLRYGK